MFSKRRGRGMSMPAEPGPTLYLYDGSIPRDLGDLKPGQKVAVTMMVRALRKVETEKGISSLELGVSGIKAKAAPKKR